MIQQPRSGIANGTSLIWNNRFSTVRNSQFVDSQKVIDMEVLRRCSPLVPFDNGTLEKSGILNTVIGSGKVVYKTPYAKKMYYNPKYNFQGAPRRGALWFKRMKISNRKQILKLAGQEMRGL